jgi:hypothetical protein
MVEPSIRDVGLLLEGEARKLDVFLAAHPIEPAPAPMWDCECGCRVGGSYDKCPHCQRPRPATAPGKPGSLDAAFTRGVEFIVEKGTHEVLETRPAPAQQADWVHGTTIAEHDAQQAAPTPFIAALRANAERQGAPPDIPLIGGKPIPAPAQAQPLATPRDDCDRDYYPDCLAKPCPAYKLWRSSGAQPPQPASEPLCDLCGTPLYRSVDGLWWCDCYDKPASGQPRTVVPCPKDGGLCVPEDAPPCSDCPRPASEQPRQAWERYRGLPKVLKTTEELTGHDVSGT